MQYHSGAADPNLRLEVHSYDPYRFCLQTPPTQSSWGTPADKAVVQEMYANMSQWSAAHGGRRVLMGEAGCQVAAPSRDDRLEWYATVAAAARSSLGGLLCVWDDDGWYKIYDRANRVWDEGVMTALGLAPTAVAPAPKPSPHHSQAPSPSSPQSCPGGGLEGCIRLCPSAPAGFQVCVHVCEERCEKHQKRDEREREQAGQQNKTPPAKNENEEEKPPHGGSRPASMNE